MTHCYQTGHAIRAATFWADNRRMRRARRSGRQSRYAWLARQHFLRWRFDVDGWPHGIPYAVLKGTALGRLLTGF